MGSAKLAHRLVVNADDFGRSPSINAAVIRAHRDGILTTASLMVNGDAFTEAVDLAKQNPRLGVGLHLTLVCGRSTLLPDQIPGLVDRRGFFSDDPVRVGVRYFFLRSLVPQLEQEVAAQVNKFRETGLTLDHLNGHLNLHLHPTVFQLLLRHQREWAIRTMRLTHDPLRLNLQLDRGRYGYRLSHALVFGALSRWAKPLLNRGHIRHTQAVFGLLQNGLVSEGFVVKLLSSLPVGDSELYSHPSMEEFVHEFDALVSPKVIQAVRAHRIQLTRYQDL